jgi:hypothetical protein
MRLPEDGYKCGLNMQDEHCAYIIRNFYTFISIFVSLIYLIARRMLIIQKLYFFCLSHIVNTYWGH